MEMLRNFKLRIEIRLIFLTYNPEKYQIQTSVKAKQSRIVFFSKNFAVYRRGCYISLYQKTDFEAEVVYERLRS